MNEPLDELRFKARSLIRDLTQLTGEPEEIVVVRALEERLRRLTEPTSATERANRILAILESSLWRNMPASKLGTSNTREQQDQILGYGPEGI